MPRSAFPLFTAMPVADAGAGLIGAGLLPADLDTTTRPVGRVRSPRRRPVTRLRRDQRWG
jgi:hypothetical protein